MKIVLVCGTRPNFVKIAPLLRAIKNYNESSPDRSVIPLLVNTGQHYDNEMSGVFFKDLELPLPNVNLNIGSGSNAWQTGRILIEFEKYLLEERPRLVIVVGDVNSTLGGALTAAKLQIPVAHVEAGLRSYDRSMPEEINRLLTDSISDYLFTTSPDADENLKKEGILPEKIYLVGNVMADCLLQNKDKINGSLILNRLGLEAGKYAVLTLHRIANVDNRETLERIIRAVTVVSHKIMIIFPCHPRTARNLKEFNIGAFSENENIRLTQSLGYLDFLNLEMNAKFVLTDSGGIQEETSILNVPCLTLRDTTEWVITVEQGTNILVGSDIEKIVTEANKIIAGRGKTGICPELWDGKASERIVETLSRYWIRNHRMDDERC